MNKFTCWNKGLRAINCPTGPQYHPECDNCGWNPIVDRARRKELRKMDALEIAEMCIVRAAEYKTVAERLD